LQTADDDGVGREVDCRQRIDAQGRCYDTVAGVDCGNGVDISTGCGVGMASDCVAIARADADVLAGSLWHNEDESDNPVVSIAPCKTNPTIGKSFYGYIKEFNELSMCVARWKYPIVASAIVYVSSL